MNNVIIDTAERVLDNFRETLITLVDAKVISDVDVSEKKIELEDPFFDALFPNPTFEPVQYYKTKVRAIAKADGVTYTKHFLVDRPQVEVEDELAE